MSLPRAAACPPVCASLCRPDEKHRPERRQIQPQRVWISLGTFSHRAQPRLSVIAGAAEFYVVGIKYFLIVPWFGGPDAVAVPRHRRRIEYAGDRSAAVLSDGAARERPDAFIGIVQIHPAESFVMAIAAVQLRRPAVQVIQIAHAVAQAPVIRRCQLRPLELAAVPPFLPLTEFRAHEQELFSGMGAH